MWGYIATAAGGFALAALLVLWPGLLARWKASKELPPLAKWVNGPLPGTRDPIGPNLPKATPPGHNPADIIPMRKKGAA